MRKTESERCLPRLWPLGHYSFNEWFLARRRLKAHLCWLRHMWVGPLKHPLRQLQLTRSKDDWHRGVGKCNVPFLVCATQSTRGVWE